MYKIYTPHGIIETESFNEVLKYQSEGCTFERIPEEFDPEAIFDNPAEYQVIGEAFLVEPEKI